MIGLLHTAGLETAEHLDSNFQEHVLYSGRGREGGMEGGGREGERGEKEGWEGGCDRDEE